MIIIIYVYESLYPRSLVASLSQWFRQSQLSSQASVMRRVLCSLEYTAIDPLTQCLLLFQFQDYLWSCVSPLTQYPGPLSAHSSSEIRKGLSIDDQKTLASVVSWRFIVCSLLMGAHIVSKYGPRVGMTGSTV